jgi:hypothetical protein
MLRTALVPLTRQKSALTSASACIGAAVIGASLSKSNDSSTLLFRPCTGCSSAGSCSEKIVSPTVPSLLSSMEKVTEEMQEIASLIVPTFEALVRAARLISTAATIAADYQMNAMLRQHPDSAVTKIYKLSFESNNAEYQQHESQLHELENAVTQLEKDLERAQREYVSSGGGSKSHQSLSESTLAKREQKETMMTIANHLSAAQEALTMLHRNGGAASNLHERNAIRLLDLCRTNGGVYIKVGQHLANLDLLLPEEYIHILSSLFDDAPSTNYQDVCRVVTEDLGCSPDELFDDFSRQPFASASLAQVHTAKCKTSGKKVSRNYYSINLTRITKPMLFLILTAKKLAIKIQHKGLRETSTGDLFAMSTVVRIADKLFDDFNFMWICEELTPQLPRELDFKNGM